MLDILVEDSSSEDSSSEDSASEDDTTPTTPTSTPNFDPADLISRAERSAMCEYEG